MKLPIIIISTLFSVACVARSSYPVYINECDENNVYEQLECSMHSLEIKKDLLSRLGNQSRSDFQIWEYNVIKQCEINMSDKALGESMSGSLECKHRLYDERINMLKRGYKR